MRTADGGSLPRARSGHAGGDQYVAVGNSVYGVGRPVGTRLYDRGFGKRPCSYDPCVDRSGHAGIRSGTSGTHLPAAGPQSGRVAPSGTHRSRDRSDAYGRPATRWGVDRDYERGWNDGPYAGLGEDSPEVRNEDHLDCGYYRLSSAFGVDCRTRRDGGYADRVGTLQVDSVPSVEQRFGSCRSDQRGVEAR